MPAKNELRQTGKRAQVQIDVDLSTYGKYFLSKLENVSIGGAFVRTRDIHPVGTEVKLRFQLPDASSPIDVIGEVVWVYDQPGRTQPNSSGMGIKFTTIDQNDQGRIADFVAQAAS